MLSLIIVKFDQIKFGLAQEKSYLYFQIQFLMTGVTVQVQKPVREVLVITTVGSEMENI